VQTSRIDGAAGEVGVSVFQVGRGGHAMTAIAATQTELDRRQPVKHPELV